jgi:beta-lactam-binding protein with PASTA domain
VRVPDIVGLNLADAEAELDEAGLKVGLRREIPSDTASEGVFVEQGCPAGPTSSLVLP